MDTEFWFFDTCTLMNVAVDTRILAFMQRVIKSPRRIAVLADAVLGELEEISDGNDPDAPLAARALTQLNWLQQVPVTHAVLLNSAIDFQLEIAGGRSLKHPREHWGESVICALIKHSSQGTPTVIADDFGARVAVAKLHAQALSIPKFLHQEIASGTISAQDAEALTDALRQAGRGADFTAQELRTGRGLGRAGEP